MTFKPDEVSTLLESAKSFCRWTLTPSLFIPRIGVKVALITEGDCPFCLACGNRSMSPRGSMIPPFWIGNDAIKY